jgi:hypothetical protein
MSSVVVFALGLSALTMALWLVVRYRGTERAGPLELDRESSVAERLSAVVGRASGMMAGAVLASVLVLGMGGRWMMRVLAATSPESAQGRLTDAEERVGEVTFEGTIGFVVFIGLFGGLFSLAVIVVLRRWLPRRSLGAGLVVAGLGAGLLARPTGFVDPHNRDFLILSPAWLAVLLALALMVLHGLLLVVLVDRWSGRWVGPKRSGLELSGEESPRRRWVALVPFVVVLALSAVVVVPALIIIAVVSYAIFVLPRLGHVAWLRRSEIPGRWAVGAAGLMGAIWTAMGAVEVLTL